MGILEPLITDRDDVRGDDSERLDFSKYSKTNDFLSRQKREKQIKSITCHSSWLDNPSSYKYLRKHAISPPRHTFPTGSPHRTTSTLPRITYTRKSGRAESILKVGPKPALKPSRCASHRDICPYFPDLPPSASRYSLRRRDIFPGAWPQNE